MLQNGTVISDVMIEKPKSFSTACNIATQAVAQIASSQYGGQSITLSHLVPFVEISRQKYRRDVRAEFEVEGMELDEQKINEIAEMRVRKEVKQGVQVIQYQVITLMTTNGQAPFVTVFMYLDEVEAWIRPRVWPHGAISPRAISVRRRKRFRLRNLREVLLL